MIDRTALQTIGYYMTVEELRGITSRFSAPWLLLFPALLTTWIGVLVAVLAITRIPPHSLVVGLVAITSAVGALSALSALEGVEGLDDLVGDQTFILYSYRAQPVSARTLLALFIGTDLLLYAGLFVIPLGVVIGVLILMTELHPSSVAVITLGVNTMYAYLLTLSVLLTTINITNHWHHRKALLTSISAGIGVLSLVGGLGAATMLLSPSSGYAMLTTPILVLPITAATFGIVGIAIMTYTPHAHSSQQSNYTSSTPRAWIEQQVTARLGNHIMTISLLRILRQRRQLVQFVGYPIVSGAIGAGLWWVLSVALGSGVSLYILLCSGLTLTGFFFYLLVTHYDTPQDYTYLPIETNTVLQQKRRLAVGLTIAVGVLSSTILLPISDGVGEALLGVGSAGVGGGYVAWISGKIGKHRPNQLLFDPRRLLAFTLAVAPLFSLLALLALMY